MPASEGSVHLGTGAQLSAGASARCKAYMHATLPSGGNGGRGTGEVGWGLEAAWAKSVFVCMGGGGEGGAAGTIASLSSLRLPRPRAHTFSPAQPRPTGVLCA
jgi:hypothetical protein